MSAATVALCLKTPAAALSEKPRSGVTETWTKSLAESTEMTNGHEAFASIGPPIVGTFSTSTAGTLTSTEYAVTMDRLRSLIADEDEDERPSEEACAHAVRLLREAALHVGMRFPRGIVATGPARSVRLLWSGNDKELRVVIGGSTTNRSYIYWRRTGHSGVDETLEGRRFAEYLSWVVQDA
jgi:hypothetical protein